MAFRGTFDFSLDAKNRLTVPAKFRNVLGDSVVLAKGVERCVVVWRPDDYDAYVKGVTSQFAPMSTQREKLQRFFSANAHDTDIDGAGRVMVPGFLAEHAGLGKEVVVTGADDRLEIWDRAAWAAYNDQLAGDITDISELLGNTAA